MGADNWAICPQCKLRPNPYHEERQATLREDYELGILPDGEFYVIYSGDCQVCKLRKEFKHSEKVKLKPTP